MKKYLSIFLFITACGGAPSNEDMKKLGTWFLEQTIGRKK